ncbi:uncharacterized protein CDAR_553231 [Caerostris darwini]|uniref:Uncharacterized protein n=1 Tax=Caerostris darwini TaxID=1538125 RepID=A0AAV4X0U4_9ARAC|nr:uncharacterized protein CDAR_553231 [Caerostris darwini]
MDDLKSLQDIPLDKNKFFRSRLSFDTPDGSCQQQKAEDISLKKGTSAIRRFIRATCLCTKSSKKEDMTDVYVAYNPSYKPPS